MPFSKPTRGETSKPTGRQHLYLIFDDWELGYSIRELNLSRDQFLGFKQQRLPVPFIRLEATRGCPEFFAAVGTKILATHPRDDSLAPGGILPIVDVRSRGVNLAPGEFYPRHPIYIPVDEELFALDMDTFQMLSMKALCPPLRQEHEYEDQISEWSWCNLPMPTFKRMDVTSYAVDSDGKTILASTAAATFAFDSQVHKWKMLANWSLPFSGRATFVHGLDVFVGLPKDEDAAFGDLCFCRWLGGDDKRVSFSKEKLLSNHPAERHVGTTLVYLGETRFCLVECVSNGDAEAVQKWLEKWKESKYGLDPTVWEDCPLGTHCYLTTFCLYARNDVLRVAEIAVQCYEVPVGASVDVNPAAFWL